uniref:Uncharacterized protein n=1 Tax=viral metagenome TaxID=1070528 RepID=A0A6H1Z9V4_9ZZZZ
MATFVFKQLGIQTALDTNVVATTVLYTVPASNRALIREILVNSTAAGATGVIQINKGGASLAIISVDVLTGTLANLPLHTMLETGDILEIDITVGAVGAASIVVSGIEISTT